MKGQWMYVFSKLVFAGILWLLADLSFADGSAEKSDKRINQIAWVDLDEQPPYVPLEAVVKFFEDPVLSDFQNIESMQPEVFDTYRVRFKVPYRGSVNPSPLGDG